MLYCMLVKHLVFVFSARKRGRPRKSDERKDTKSSFTSIETVSVPEQSKMDSELLPFYVKLCAVC